MTSQDLRGDEMLGQKILDTISDAGFDIGVLRRRLKKRVPDPDPLGIEIRALIIILCIVPVGTPAPEIAGQVMQPRMVGRKMAHR